MTGKVYIVSIGPGGSVDYLTTKALNILKKADIAIFSGELIGNEILNQIYGKKYVGKGINSEFIHKQFLLAKEKGLNVVLMEQGDASLFTGEYGVFDSLSGNVDWLHKNEIPYEVIPGVSSFQAIAAKLNIEYTIPQKNQTVILNSPIWDNKNYNECSLTNLFKTKASIVIFMGIDKLEALVKVASKHYDSATPFIIGYKISWSDESIVVSNVEKALRDIDKSLYKRHCIVLIGDSYKILSK